MMNKSMNRAISFALTLMLVLTSVVTMSFAATATLPGQKVELTAPTGDINVGDTVEIPVTINNPNTLKGVVVKVSWDPTLLEADPTSKMGKYACYVKPANNADDVNMFAQIHSINLNDVATGSLSFGGASGYVFEDYTTAMSLGTLKLKVLDAAAGKTVTVTVDEVETYATSERGNEVLDTPTNATFTVVGAATPTYEIKFVDEKGEVLDTQIVNAGDIPVYSKEEPTKEATAEYTYTFAGWGEVVAATENKTYTAQFTQEKRKYTITFLDENDDVIKSTQVEYGVMPECEAPTKAATDEFTYVFAGWEPSVETVKGDATYKATYTEIPVEATTYTITFVDEDDNVLEAKPVVEGTMPEYTGATPTKEATAEYTYTFAGWDSEIKPATEDATYKATYTETKNKYTITFVNEDETVLWTTEVEYGNTPVYGGETATKAPTYTDTEVQNYVFSAWTPELAAVTGAATYKATFVEGKKTAREMKDIAVTPETDVTISNSVHSTEDEGKIAEAVRGEITVKKVFNDEGHDVELTDEEMSELVITADYEAKTATIKYGDFTKTVTLYYKSKSSGLSSNTISGKPSNNNTNNEDKKDDTAEEDKKDDTEDKTDVDNTEDKKDDTTEDNTPVVDKPFADIADENSHWAAKSAYKLYERGIISGDAEGKANLDNYITRQETAKLAILVHDIAISGGDINHTDAADVSDWAKDYIATATKEGIITGYADGTVKPLANVTREEMVAIIIRALGITLDEVANVDFKDADTLTWSKGYVAAAVQLGFVNGYEDGTFKGTNNITRGEAMAIFERVLAFKDALANIQ